MDIIIPITTILISLISTGGVIVNNSLSNLLKNQSYQIEEISLRVNSVPNYQLLTGSAQGIQLATRGWAIGENIRFELFELETDEIKVNLAQLQQMKGDNWRKALIAPLAMGFHLVMTENDLNNLFKSALVQSLIADFSQESSQVNPEIINLQFDLLPDNQIMIETEMKLASQEDQVLAIRLEFGLELIKGYQLTIVNPQGTLNQRKLSSKLLQGFADNINMQLDLRILEESGITLRLLQLEIKENNLDIVGLAYITNQ
jgi:hypothetical protein